MNQQAARESWEIASNFWTQELREMISGMPPEQLTAPAAFDDDGKPLPRAMNYDSSQTAEQWLSTSRYGKTAAVRLDPMEIQEEYEVEPEAGSYLAVDDDLRRAAAMDLEQVAMAAPDVVDHRKVVRFHLSTIRGIGNPDDYIIPENPNPQPPPFKGNIGVNLPLDKMPSDIVNQILPNRQSERANQQQLPRGGLQQIGAAHHFRDSHRRVIGHDRKLIGGHVVAPPDHEVAEVASGDEVLPTLTQIVELGGLAIGNEEPPVHVLRRVVRFRCAELFPAAAGIERLVVAFLVGSGRRIGQVLARAVAGIDASGIAQLAPGIEVEIAPGALRIGRERPANVRSFLPANAEPAQVFHHRPRKLQLGALRVKVFVAKYQRAAIGLRALECGPEGAGVPDVQQSRRRGRQPSAIGQVLRGGDGAHEGIVERSSHSFEKRE